MNNDLMPPDPTSYRQIKVLGEYVNIEWLPQRVLPDCYGQTQVEHRTVQLRNNLDGMQCLDTFIHELNHYISERCSLELTEQQVHNLGMAWSTIFYDNPELLGFIAERMTEEDERRIR